MAEFAGIVIKVKTNQLISAASEVDRKIDQLERVFAGMEQTVNASRRYWDGDGVSAHVSAYRSRADQIQTALRRFQENADHLRQIAGVYTESEQSLTSAHSVLRTDWIE